MILLEIRQDQLRPAERFGLEVLLDLSRLLVAERADCDLVRLRVVERPSAGSAAADLSPKAALERGDGEVRVTTAALHAIAEVAGGAIEQRSTATDRHGRVPATENPLVAAGQSRRPVVSLLANELRRAAFAVAGRRPVRAVAPWPDGHRWAALVTHDLDIVDWWGLSPLLRMAQLGVKGDWQRVAHIARAAQRSLGRDPVNRGIHALLQLEAHHGIRSTWFVICAQPTLGSMLAGDSTYRPEGAAARRILAALTHAGHEIGLHGSFATADNVKPMIAQRRALSRLADSPVEGNRQHFLRMHPGRSQRIMVQAGFEYDASWGFPDRNGFRLGVADVVPAWDAEQEKALPLDLIPLVWMDRALSKYAGVEEAGTWIEDARELARECKAAEGAWVGLWHPNTMEALGFPGAEPAFVSLLQSLADERPYFASAHKMVQWRRFRRSVRVARVSADGRVILSTVEGQRTVIAIEDEAGDTVRLQVKAARSGGAA
ncbi:MAG TPA: hypothetical protein VJ808_01905 [Gemmatimonadales bacterium]|nr:hypothetical protein [Gemmatimonadales bacterium]